MSPVAGRPVLVGVIVVVVLAAIVTGLVILGPPGEERARRIDERRVDELQRIAAAARLFHMRHGRLPPALSSMAAEPGVSLELLDPVTREPYVYRMAGTERYEICAVFDRESSDERPDFWSHGAGEHCFTLGATEVR
jgi:hypothetical protein